MWYLRWSGWQWDRSLSKYFGFPVTIIPPMLPTHSYITDSIQPEQLIASLKKPTLLKCKCIVQWDYHNLSNNDWLKRQGDDEDEESACCVMAQVVCHHPLTPEASVQPQGSPCGICGGLSGNRTGFPHNTSIFPLPIIIPPLVHTHCIHSPSILQNHSNCHRH